MKEQTGKLLTLLLIATSAWLLLFWNSIVDMVSVWSGSETYKHCFLIVPVVIYLLWERKSEFKLVTFKGNYFALIPLILSLLVHLVAQLMMINVLVHLSIYFSLIFLLWTILGTSFVRFAKFPLFFLIFAVPLGEELVPLLQQITADLSVFIIQLVGVPIYRDGLYLHVPGGSFVVAEACAGIRFLIATIAIGALYAYLFFTSTKRRLLFIIACLIIPILANGMRAAGIVLVGYYSDMQHAVGADHLVYGWVFFSIVLGLIILVGQLFQEAPVPLHSADNNNSNDYISPKNIDLNKSKIITSLLIIVLFTFHFYGSSIQTATSSAKEFQLPLDTSNMEISNNTPSMPTFETADKIFTFKNKDASIYIAQYFNEEKNKELINWNNRQFDPEKFSIKSRDKISFLIDSIEAEAEVLQLSTSHGQSSTLVYTYIVENLVTDKAIPIKLAQLKSKLRGDKGAGSLIQFFFHDSRSKSEVINYIESLQWHLNI